MDTDLLYYSKNKLSTERFCLRTATDIKRISS